MSDGGILAHGAVAIGGVLIFLKLCADDVARRRTALKRFEEELSAKANRPGLADSDNAITPGVVDPDVLPAPKPRR